MILCLDVENFVDGVLMVDYDRLKRKVGTSSFFQAIHNYSYCPNLFVHCYLRVQSFLH